MIADSFSVCLSCHAAGGLAGINLSNYESIMLGGDKGAIIIPGDAANSPLVLAQQTEPPHFGQFTNQQLEEIIAWINAGANE
jgi:mono/diheme cytochrome c family protein